MQYDAMYEGLTEHYKAMTFRQPLADQIASGEITEIIRKRGTSYRGDLMIVASPLDAERGGMMVGMAELYDIRHTDEGYVYMFKNSRRLIEFPCQKSTMKGDVWDCYYTAGVVREYPRIKLNLKINV